MSARRTIATIVGARPQFIKASAVSAAFAGLSDIDELIVHTGQHYDANMSDVFFEELGIPRPAYDLEIHGGSHGAMTGRMLEAIERVLMDVKPDAVLVYGDTNSTIAGALAAAKLHVPIAHVEAGLRSFNLKMPEEVNRILTDRISTWLFTPSGDASEHLRREGTDAARIHQVGDVMYDVALLHGSRVAADDPLFAKLGIEPGRFVLATVHRAENTAVPHRLSVIIEALMALASDLPVVWPMHPRTRAALAEEGRLERLAGVIQVIEPLSYLDMVRLEKFAALLATDSGGVQKEAFFYEVPCVTLRDETEWVELVEAGWNRLAPPVAVASVTAALQDALGSRGRPIAPFGRGDAAVAIARVLDAGLHA
jgi:UDP-GlcNAc3NAcA epimerase